PPSLRAIVGPILSFYSTHGVFPAVQTAARVAIESPQGCVETMRAAYQDRRDALLAGLAGQTAISVPRPAGAVYVVADVSRARGAHDIGQLADAWLEAGVAVLPGPAFGSEYGDWVRISLS